MLYITNQTPRDEKIISKTLQQALEISDQSGVHVLDFMIIGNAAWACILRKRFSEAQKYIVRMERELLGKGQFDQSFFYFLRGFLAFCQNRISDADADMDTSLKLILDIGCDLPVPKIYILKAKVLYQQGNVEVAFKFVDKAIEYSEQRGLKSLLFSCYANKACFYYKMNNPSQGLNAIKQAMALGREIGLFASHLVEKDLMAYCCAKALENDVEKEYVLELIRTCSLLMPEKFILEEWPWKLKIYTLDQFSIVSDGKPLILKSGKAGKPLEMLKVLLSYGGRRVKESTITEALWPDADGDMQQQSLHTTIHRLRKLLGSREAIEFRDKKISLNNKYCWVDFWAFEHFLAKSDENWKQGNFEEAVHVSEKALAIYKNSFLSNEATESYMIPLQAKLRSRFLRTVLRLGEYYEKQDRFEKAIHHYEHGLAIDPLVEEFYQHGMHCLQQLGNTTAALTLYKRCCTILENVLGASPSEKTVTIYQDLLSQ
jgi:LuxR family maltose regulon positive regulatory protein